MIGRHGVDQAHRAHRLCDLCRRRGLVFLGLAFSPIGPRARVIGWLVALIALVLATLTAEHAIPWYFGAHLGLDNGYGG